MLLYPSQDDLLNKINSKYSLVILAAKRAKQLHNEDDTQMLEEYKSVKNVGKSLEEIIAGDLVIDPDSIEK
ncbi:DNA-directed RNA polymerase subunit omega [Alkalibacterium subtropicum]|uniref:DNA-directed RNA polymerase subunit omega n=1 Tax=Alkalibacterium subtropicum TaxID=753702 RepID=A0A1I1EJU8_9LACT|nr:DNA-directed RNA polymerase subunit omega [Alkalibacterium subtropicum]SFB87341.1 DNA-directed RNA polymerase subunit omega [Alkalibacterium subtropicum]